MGRQRREVDTTSYSGRLAVRIRELREAKRLTVEQLADKLDVSLFTVYAWESGTRDVTTNRIPALAKALGVKRVEDLFPPLR